MNTTRVRRFLQDEQGVTAIEYGLLAALIGVGIITAAALLGTKIGDLFTTIANKLGAAST
jgi:pilus assembly protein Flp/PilA